MADMSAAPPEAILAMIPMDQVLGAVVVGVGVNAFFYGFSVLQFVQYRTRLFRDSWTTQ